MRERHSHNLAVFVMLDVRFWCPLLMNVDIMLLQVRKWSSNIHGSPSKLSQHVECRNVFVLDGRIDQPAKFVITDN